MQLKSLHTLDSFVFYLADELLFYVLGQFFLICLLSSYNSLKGTNIRSHFFNRLS